MDGDGGFDRSAAEDVALRSGLDGAGVAYQCVAVMGPQSSGKSTLLNAMVRVCVGVVGVETRVKNNGRALGECARPPTCRLTHPPSRPTHSITV